MKIFVKSCHLLDRMKRYNPMFDYAIDQHILCNHRQLIFVLLRVLQVLEPNRMENDQSLFESQRQISYIMSIFFFQFRH